MLSLAGTHFRPRSTSWSEFIKQVIFVTSRRLRRRLFRRVDRDRSSLLGEYAVELQFFVGEQLERHDSHVVDREVGRGQLGLAVHAPRV